VRQQQLRTIAANGIRMNQDRKTSCTAGHSLVCSWWWVRCNLRGQTRRWASTGSCRVRPCRQDESPTITKKVWLKFMPGTGSVNASVPGQAINCKQHCRCHLVWKAHRNSGPATPRCSLLGFLKARSSGPRRSVSRPICSAIIFFSLSTAIWIQQIVIFP
jgi:hypothetical protein